MAVELRGFSSVALGAQLEDRGAVDSWESDSPSQEMDMIQGMLMKAQQKLQSELELTDVVMVETFQMMARDMGNRFVAFTQQIQKLQTAVVIANGQNRELRETQSAQVEELKSQLAAKQAEITALKAKVTDLQQEASVRAAAAQAAQIEAVRATQAAGDAQAQALLDRLRESHKLKEQASSPLAGLDSIIKGVEWEYDVLWRRAQYGSDNGWLASATWQKKQLFERILEQLKSIRNELVESERTLKSQYVH